MLNGLKDNFKDIRNTSGCQIGLASMFTNILIENDL